MNNLLVEAQFSKKRVRLIIIFLCLLLVCLFFLALCVGKYSVTPKESLQIVFSKLLGLPLEVEPLTESVVLRLRLPRICAAILVGLSLSMAGAAFQGAFRNPLVSSDFLGVSSGACVGAAIGILFGSGLAMIQTLAFFGGLVSVTIILLVPRLIRSTSNVVLVLCGIIVGGMMSSIFGLIKYIADPETQLAAITYWQLGSLSYVRLSDIYSVLPTMLLSAITLIAVSWWINVLTLGDKEAKSLGVNVSVIRTLTIAAATLLTASSVCISGTVAWVGLVIPNFGRILVGPENTQLIRVSGLIGAVFMLVVDTAARTLSVAELPLSVLTGLIGAPFFVWLLYKQRTRLQ